MPGVPETNLEKANVRRIILFDGLLLPFEPILFACNYSPQLRISPDENRGETSRTSKLVSFLYIYNIRAREYPY